MLSLPTLTWIFALRVLVVAFLAGFGWCAGAWLAGKILR